MKNHPAQAAAGNAKSRPLGSRGFAVLDSAFIVKHYAFGA
jgi:hypothetical protein